MTTQHDERANLRLMPCPFCGENSDLRVYEHYDDAYFLSGGDLDSVIDAAITHANQVLEGGGK